MTTRFVRPSILAAALATATVSGVHAQRPAYTLDTLQVTVGSRASADLPAATRAVQVIRAEDLARQPGLSIQDVLTRVFGADVSARSPAQADIALRGGTYEQVLVLVDGVRASDSQTGHFDLSLAAPLQEIERIEVLRGPASAVYGADALGGVINIVTRRHTEPRIHAQIDGGSFETMAMTAGAQYGGAGVRIGGTGEYRRSDGHRPGTDYEIAAGHIAVETTVKDRPLRATVAFADRDFGASKFYTAPESDFDEFERTQLLSAQVAWESPAAARFTVEPRVSVRRHDDDFVLRRNDPSFYRNRHRTWQAGGELVARYTSDGARAALGGEAWRDILRSSSLGDREESRAAVFAEAGLGHSGAAVATAGLRVDWHSAYGSFVAPSLAGAAWLTPSTRVRASASRAFRAPTWTDRYYSDPANLGNADLDPEQAWGGEIGFDAGIGGITTQVSAYIRRTESLIDWARPDDSAPTDPWQIMNVAEATFRGVEIALTNVKLLGGVWAARFAGIDFDSEASGYTSKYALRPLTRQASIEVQHAVAGVDVFARGGYARRAGEQGYTLLDARVGRDIAGVRAFVDVTNILDERYLDVSRMRAAGRALYAGLSWRSR